MIRNLYIAAVFAIFAGAGLAQRANAQSSQAKFELYPNPPFLSCLADPNSYDPPHATVTVVRGKLNDHLILEAEHIKPGLQFDLFTVQNTNLTREGTVDPNFKGFGLAWYQSDVQADKYGKAYVEINTILLDQIFGFDPAVSLPPTNTFHVGFWFNDPNDAAACGFNPNNPTPFNGEHKAGPTAMISVSQDNGLGPLCTNPDNSKNPPVCNP